MFYILMPERCLRRPPVDSGRVHPSPPLEKNVSEIGSPCSRESSDSRDPGRFRSEKPFTPPRKNFFSENVLHLKRNIFFFASVTPKNVLTVTDAAPASRVFCLTLSLLAEKMGCRGDPSRGKEKGPRPGQMQLSPCQVHLSSAESSSLSPS